MPSSCSVRITRTAISPRLAMSTRVNMRRLQDRRTAVGELELEQELPVLDRLGVLRVDRADDARVLDLDLVHELHRLEDAERLAGHDDVSDADERARSRLRGTVERPHHRRLDADQTGGGRQIEHRLELFHLFAW